MYSVYKMTFPNDKLYVGITSDFNQRIYQHKYESTKRKFKLQRAINKYGWDNIKKEVVCFNLSKEQAQDLEVYLIASMDLTNKGYNTTPGGEFISDNNALLGKIRMQNPEYKEKILKALWSNEKQRLESLRSSSQRKKRSEIAKKRSDEGKNKLPVIKKPIMCVETGEKFESMDAAAKHFKGQRQHLTAHMSGKKYRKKFKGHTFKFIEVTNDNSQT